MQRIKILFIAGWGRTGSTLLSGLLGQTPGFFATGELTAVHQAVQANRRCACGASLRECPRWSTIANELLAMPAGETERLIRTRRRLWRPRSHLLRLLWRGRWRRDEAIYADHLAGLLSRLETVTGCRVIVDSTKAPFHGAILDRIPSVDLFVLHLIRDPRAVAFSWNRRKAWDPGEADPKLMRRMGALPAAIRWLIYNQVIEGMWARRRKHGRYLRLRYEDLAADPAPTLERVLTFFGEPPPENLFSGRHTATVTERHELSGNPSRFDTGSIEIVLDDEWRAAMPRGRRLLVTITTWPLLRRYGYAGRRSAPQGRGTGRDSAAAATAARAAADSAAASRTPGATGTIR